MQRLSEESDIKIMQKIRPTANPSRLLTLVKAYERGELTLKELKKLRLEVLGMNVYTGKAKKDEREVYNPKTLHFAKD